MDELLAEIKEEFPKFRVIRKEDSAFMKVLNVFLKIITFGQMKTFMVDFITTIGSTVYTPTAWESRMADHQKIGVLRHERVHMRQEKRLTRPVYWFLYIFFILPGGLAYGRCRLEQEAYAESMKVAAENYGVAILDNKRYREAMVEHFTGPEYFWMWPFRSSIEAWYDATAQRIRDEQ